MMTSAATGASTRVQSTKAIDFGRFRALVGNREVCTLALVGAAIAALWAAALIFLPENAKAILAPIKDSEYGSLLIVNLLLPVPPQVAMSLAPLFFALFAIPFAIGMLRSAIARAMKPGADVEMKVLGTIASLPSLVLAGYGVWALAAEMFKELDANGLGLDAFYLFVWITFFCLLMGWRWLAIVRHSDSTKPAMHDMRLGILAAATPIVFLVSGCLGFLVVLAVPIVLSIAGLMLGLRMLKCFRISILV